MSESYGEISLNPLKILKKVKTGGDRKTWQGQETCNTQFFKPNEYTFFFCKKCQNSTKSGLKSPKFVIHGQNFISKMTFSFFEEL